MRAAIYTRYSTDKQREASIEDQVRNCEVWAEREGWEIIGRYEDRAQSGAKTDRPGYQAMLAEAEDRKFDVLIVDDLSRLSRDDIELKQTVRRFRFWELRIVGVSDGFDSASKGYKIHAGVRGLINDIYLDDLREKTHRGMTGQALKGNNAGGRVYGYLHVPIEDPNRKDEYGLPEISAVRREVNPEQAEVVRQIYRWYANGRRPRWIAVELNNQGVPSPRGGTWAGSALLGAAGGHSGILSNELYVGRYVWNRSRWVRDPDTGKRKRLVRPKDEWVIVDLPHLRIVDDELWKQVQARQREQRKGSKTIRRALHGRARTGAGPKYLFSGLLKCGACGANYTIMDSHRYGCSKNVNRGETVCANRLRVPRGVVESRLLIAIKRDLFTPEGIELFKKETSRLLAEYRARRRPDRAQVQRRLAEVQVEIDNIMKAIKAGILTPHHPGRAGTLRAREGGP